MPSVQFAPEVTEDFDRILDHLAQFGAGGIPQRIQEIIVAFNLLEQHPLIGRTVERGRRELVLGKAGRGYVGLYQFLPALDMVIVLAIRSQREGGYAR